MISRKALERMMARCRPDHLAEDLANAMAARDRMLGEVAAWERRESDFRRQMEAELDSVRDRCPHDDLERHDDGMGDSGATCRLCGYREE